MRFSAVYIRKWRAEGARNGLRHTRDTLNTIAKVLATIRLVLVTNSVMCSILCNLKLTRVLVSIHVEIYKHLAGCRLQAWERPLHLLYKVCYR